MTSAYIVHGVLTDTTTLKLDEPLPIVATKVRVTIEPIPTPSVRPIVEVVDEIWAQQKAEGRVPPTREQVDEYLRNERAAWGDHQ